MCLFHASQKVASKNASLVALQKVAEVVHGNSGSRKKNGHYEVDDLFDPKEKLMLGLDDL